ncbi:MAG: RNA polymerase sigma factor [Bacteroidota bacterium]
MNPADFQKLSDNDVITLIIEKGEKQALGILYDRYAAAIFRKCLAMCGNAEQAKDLAHDVILKSFMSLSSLKNRDAYKFWVNRIAYNICIDYLNLKKKMKIDFLEEGSPENVTEDNSTREEKVLKEMQLEQLEILFQELSEQDRVILLMQYQDAMRIEDIAEILQIGKSAAKMRIKRAKERLVKLYDELATNQL